MLLEWIAIGGIGAMIGFGGGLFGVGGGMIAVPILALGFGLEQQFAQGTTYVMASPTALLGLWHYYRHGSVDRRYAIGLAIAGGVEANGFGGAHARKMRYVEPDHGDRYAAGEDLCCCFGIHVHVELG